MGYSGSSTGSTSCASTGPLLTYTGFLPPVGAFSGGPSSIGGSLIGYSAVGSSLGECSSTGPFTGLGAISFLLTTIGFSSVGGFTLTSFTFSSGSESDAKTNRPYSTLLYLINSFFKFSYLPGLRATT